MCKLEGAEVMLSVVTMSGVDETVEVYIDMFQTHERDEERVLSTRIAVTVERSGGSTVVQGVRMIRMG